MKVGDAGEAFFVFETEHEVPEEFQTSPLISATSDDGRSDEEPPYLDIGASDERDQAVIDEEDAGYVSAHSASGSEFGNESDDEFESQQTTTIPPELQSPKMIIEEQLDKVVTKRDPYPSAKALEHALAEEVDMEERRLRQEEEKENSITIIAGEEVPRPTSPLPENNTYPMDDGSTLLERVSAEAITTTTVTKETFIVRPADGDILSLLMDVTHNLHDDQDKSKSESSEKRASGDETVERPTPAVGDHESMILDIAGYKIEENEEDLENETVEQAAESVHRNRKLSHIDDETRERLAEPTESEKSQQETGKEPTANADATVQAPEKSPAPQQKPQQLHEPTRSSRERSASMPLPMDELAAMTSSEKDAMAIDIPGASKVDYEPKSDSEMEYGDVASTKKQDSEWSWGWGSLPKRQEKDESLPARSSDDLDVNFNRLSIDNDDDAATREPLKQGSTTSQSVSSMEEVRLKPGRSYRIEMSLCGASALGVDPEQCRSVFAKDQISYDAFVHNPNILNDPKLVFKHEGRYYKHIGPEAPLFTSMLLLPQPLAAMTDEEGKQAQKISDSRDSYSFGRGWRQWWSRSSVASPTAGELDSEEGTMNDNTEDVPDKGTAAEEKDDNHHPNGQTTTFTKTTTTTSVGWSAQHSHADGDAPADSGVHHKNYAKTLRLTSDQLQSLKLKKGVNTISFSVNSSYQGTATCVAKIFYWQHNTQVVISDIDGTITKSDALGHVFTMIGKDWTHNGVAKLYTDIHNNGYQLLYLTSRAIGQADYTREYLKKVEQDRYQLPDGPVIMSPDRLFTSFHREVIMRKPEVFKMACLRDVQRLFSGANPFYAGFGNRITDAMSYRSVNVPASRIFTIDPQGDIKLELLSGYKSSYIHLNDLVDQIFPPIQKVIATEFNDWNFWKQPLPHVDLPKLPEPIPSTSTSPKPKPITPNPSSVPVSPPLYALPEPKPSRSILRSFTSRSQDSSREKAGKLTSYRSSPSLLARSSSRSDPDEGKHRDSANSDSLAGDQRASAAIENAESSTNGDNLETDNATSSSLSQSPSSTSGLMKQVITGRVGGLRDTISRTLSRESRKSNLSSEDLHEDEPSQGTETGLNEIPDDDLADDIDMDSIPFL
ncbi:Lipin/Ned1/Smp2-domain-containing protein [Umbelopsis sp. AD052]|nr:Lipin/Ned1/Smp2-domain-containing protein [Umbelopsis sp. AD052]